ncbi:hypothetical protein HPO96_22720 [Kribbella sandramycini]|uniref:Uncharacterized protein n=1 Tax=Kribbella sandramycini TaxID=60450 RepID=A0A7Y4L2C8_9ACTN|nr:hypothetical protein [Kribbella sandramycini]MBB6566272.1 hypothetical protein [Kribbella sandramycini]NOL43065.1 hypothetical protein [Kribbella sandramycini]
MSGDFDIFPEEANTIVLKFEAIGQAFADTWRRIGPELLGKEQQAGGGINEESVAFRAAYNEAKPLLEKASDGVGSNFRAIAATGNKMIIQVAEMHQLQTDRLRRLQ